MIAAERVQSSPGTLRVEVIADPGRLAALRPEWHELNESARAGCLFLSAEWLEPWWRHFGEGRELRVFSVRDGERLVGLLPLFEERVFLGGVPVRRLAFIGDGETGCDYLDLLAEAGRELDVLEAVVGKLLELRWDLLDLDGLLRESLTAVQLAHRFPSGRARGGVVRDGRIRHVCPHIPLAGTWEEYAQGLGRRENLRRREKWLFRQPGVSIQCARTQDDAILATRRFLELHQARWAVDGGSDGLYDGRHEAFHNEATQLLAQRGWLRMYTLFAARRPVASVYGVVHRGKFLYYQSGYDPAWGSRSVGLVLLARTVQDAFAEGLGEFDFLRGNERYKTDWARGERWTVQIRLWRGARGHLARWASGGALFARETVKAAIPRSVLEGLRKGRRILRARGDLGAALRVAFDSAEP